MVLRSDANTACARYKGNETSFNRCIVRYFKEKIKSAKDEYEKRALAILIREIEIAFDAEEFCKQYNTKKSLENCKLKFYKSKHKFAKKDPDKEALRLLIFHIEDKR